MKTELIADQAYLPSLLKLLDKAKTSVDILSFSFAIGATQKGAPLEIARKLVELRHDRKIKIRLYIEGVRETAERNRATANYLKKAGIQVVYGATHAKGFCIDNRFVLFGSTNLTNQSITKNNEANVLIDDKKAAAQFEAYFTHLWKGGGHGGIRLKAPFLADGDFKDELIDIIDRAKRRLDFSIYFFDQDDIRDALIRAHERGVDVRGFVHQHFSFGLSYIRRNFKTVKALTQAGIEDLHYSRPYTFSHSKYLVADRKDVWLGTANWLDEDIEIHPQLSVHLVDPKLAKSLVNHLTDEIKNRSAERLWSKPRASLASATL